MKNMNILIVGVGGQGTLLASRVLGNLAVAAGQEVKVSEVHGMAQRGGSVVTHVRFAESVAAPLVEPGEADIIVAFELLEALRWADYLKKGGLLLVGQQKISPMPVVMGTAKYPEDLIEQLEAKARVIKMDALAMAEQAGEARAVNLVLLGALCREMGSDKAAWEKAIAACVKEKLLAVNLKAFELGYNF